MHRVLPPRFLEGEAVELLDEISSDCEHGEVEAIACVVMIDGKCWRYSSIPDSEAARAVHKSIKLLMGDVEVEE